MEHGIQQHEISKYSKLEPRRWHMLIAPFSFLKVKYCGRDRDAMKEEGGATSGSYRLYHFYIVRPI